MKCQWCEQEMMVSCSCTANEEVEYPDGTKLPSIPFDLPDRQKCHDCNTPQGGKHHPGCDMESCPKCGGQLISCGCLDPKEE